MPVGSGLGGENWDVSIVRTRVAWSNSTKVGLDRSGTLYAFSSLERVFVVSAEPCSANAAEDGRGKRTDSSPKQITKKTREFLFQFMVEMARFHQCGSGLLPVIS
jgi:hypothetical protein